MLLTTTEACQLLRISRATIKRLAAAGKLSRIRITNNRTCYDAADLERYIAQRTDTNAATVTAAYALLAEQHATETRALCPGCGKRRVNREADMCTWCIQRHDTDKLHKQRWWEAHGNDWRDQRKAEANG